MVGGHSSSTHGRQHVDVVPVYSKQRKGFVANFHVRRFGVGSLPMTHGVERREETMMVSFKGTHFPKDIILIGVRWYVAYPLSCRHVDMTRFETAPRLAA